MCTFSYIHCFNRPLSSEFICVFLATYMIHFIHSFVNLDEIWYDQSSLKVVMFSALSSLLCVKLILIYVFQISQKLIIFRYRTRSGKHTFVCTQSPTS